MDLSQALENLKYDVRMKDWNLKQGVVKEKDLEDHTKNLKDIAANSAPLEFQEETPDSFS
jgi:hypothetical protein